MIRATRDARRYEEDYVADSPGQGRERAHAVRSHVLPNALRPVVDRRSRWTSAASRSALSARALRRDGLRARRARPHGGARRATPKRPPRASIGIVLFVTDDAIVFVEPGRRPRSPSSRPARSAPPCAGVEAAGPRAASSLEPARPGASRSRRAGARRRPSPAPRRPRTGSPSGSRARRSATPSAGCRRCSSSRTRRSACSAASCSRIGSTAWHGPHQGAQKSTTTGRSTPGGRPPRRSRR